VSVSDVTTRTGNGPNVLVGERLEVTARVTLGPIKPEEVCVEMYYGETSAGRILRPATLSMAKAEKLQDGVYRYTGSIPAKESGSYGLSVRVIPTHPGVTQPHELRLIAWAK
jgi:starch phosphorylase